MIEQEQDSSEDLTPQQLNAEFRQLYNSLPLPIFFEMLNFAFQSGTSEDEEIKNPVRSALESFHERTEQRKSSEYKELFFIKLQGLLVRAVITNNFRRTIEEQFDLMYNLGPDENSLDWLLDMESSESGGIFDPKRAKQIEVLAYGYKLERHLLTRKVRCVLEETPFDSKVESIEIQTTGELEPWRNDFIEYYGEEPLPLSYDSPPRV